MSEWISVKDSMPEDGAYLCSGHGGTHFICLARRGEWWRQSASKRIVGITHWMPLPEPPSAKPKQYTDNTQYFGEDV